jgi:competence protein ComGC
MKFNATISILLVGCCLMVPMARAEAPLAEHLPSGSLVYTGWAGRNLPFDGSNLGQLLQEPLVGQLLAVIKENIDKVPDKNAAHAWSLAGIVWQHSIAFSLIDLQAGADGPKISAALLIDLGKDKPAFSGHIDAIILNTKMRTAPVRVGQITCRTIQTPGGAVTMGYKGNIFFLTLGDQTARNLLAVKPAASLKTDKAFISRRKDVAGDNEQFAYSVDLKRLQPQISKQFNLAGPGAKGGAKSDDMVSQIVGALGLGKITSASGSTRIVDKGLYSKTRIMSPAPHRGLLMLVSGGAVGDADLAGVPDDAILCCATKFSAAAFYAEILAMARKIKPGADKDILNGVAEVEDDLGISISKDILGNLGDSWVLTSAPSLGGLATGTVLSVSVKDAKKLGTAIGKIEAWFKKETAGRRSRYSRAPSLEVLKSGKVEIHYVQNITRNAPVAPAWSVHKGKLYIALWPQVISAAIENTGKKTIVRSAAFQKIRSRVSPKPTTLTYIDTPAIVRNTYNLLLIGWTMASSEISREIGPMVSPKADWLPALPTIEKYLSPEVAAFSSDAAGVTIESYGAIPIISNFISSILTTAPVTASLLIPAIHRAKSQASKTSSRAHLSGIGKAIMMYRAEHNQVPPSLAVLVEKGYISSDALVSPVSGRSMPTDAKGLPIGKSDYVYIIHKRQTAGNVICAYELPENYDNKGTIVLRASGAIMWVDMPTLKKMLARSTRKASE